MKKIIITFLLCITLSPLFCETRKILSTQNSNIKPIDVVELFESRLLNELSNQAYKHFVINYIVFTEEQDQNYAWNLLVDDNAGYTASDGTYVNGRAIQLGTKNGVLKFNLYDMPSVWTMNWTMNINPSGNHEYESSRKETTDSYFVFISDLSTTISTFLKESELILKSHGKTFTEDEILARNELKRFSLTLESN